MKEFNVYINEKLRLNKDSSDKNIDIKRVLYTIIKDVLESDFDFARYQYIISYGNGASGDCYIIVKNPETRRSFDRRSIYKTIKDRAKDEGIDISSNVDDEKDFSSKLIIYHK